MIQFEWYIGIRLDSLEFIAEQEAPPSRNRQKYKKDFLV